MSERQYRSYNGGMMRVGKEGEYHVLDWLKKNPNVAEVIDMREFRISQRLDVDFGIETLDGKLLLAEVKTDQHLGERVPVPHFLFEMYRINHFAPVDHIFYLGWTFRSPAKYLLYYSTIEHAVYKFGFDELRKVIGSYVSKNTPRQNITPTDDQKTTFNILIPQKAFTGHFKKYQIEPIPETNFLSYFVPELQPEQMQNVEPKEQPEQI